MGNFTVSLIKHTLRPSVARAIQTREDIVWREVSSRAGEGSLGGRGPVREITMPPSEGKTSKKEPIHFLD